jgi:histidinol-phosphatase (PHP family)
VLTDYHLHLRPDGDTSPPSERWFTPANVERYLAAARAMGIEELGVAEHVFRFREALGIWDHPYWQRYARDDLDAYCEFVRNTPLRLGIELDFVPGAEEASAALLEGRGFDFVVGSVHFIGSGSVDMEEYGAWLSGLDPDEIWRGYFERLAASARSGLFDIIAHPDLVKVWGAARPGPSQDPRVFYEPAVEALAESGVAVEVSTAGLRKPAAEIYPAPEFARLCAEAGVPFALSSDAHAPDQVGDSYAEALRLLESVGVTEICVFEGRSRRLAPLGPAPNRENGGR